MMKKILFILLIVYFSLLALSTPAQAQSYAIPWWTVEGGGGTSTGSGYTLSGTIGQPDAGVMNGGGYTLTGGFWGWDVLHMIYLPLIMKQ